MVAPDPELKYRLAIFDFDGTLADTFPWFTRVIDGVAEEFGFARIGAAERQLLRSYHAREILAHLNVPMWQLPRIARRLRQLKAIEAHRLPLFPGVVELLRDLARRGVARAIASSDSEANIRSTLGPETAALIDHYACGASLFGKPAKLRKVVQRFAVLPSQAIYVGDELRDGEAAQAAGIDFAAVAWGYSTPEALRAQYPARFFTSVAEIAAALT